MRISTRIDPIDRDVALMIAEDLSPEARSRAFAEMALAGLAEAEAQNAAALGRTPGHDTFVDGAVSSDGDVARVRPDGTVVFRFRLLTDVLDYVDGLLILNSPVRSGRYARSHLLFADGVEVDPANPPPAREYVFLNAQPYARKIERGESDQARAGVYEGVATQARQRFGNVSSIKFTFRSLPSGAIGTWAATTMLRSKTSIRNRAGVKRRDWLTRQPAIIIGG